MTGGKDGDMGSFRLRQCLKSYGDEMAPAFGPSRTHASDTSYVP